MKGTKIVVSVKLKTELVSEYNPRLWIKLRQLIPKC